MSKTRGDFIRHELTTIHKLIRNCAAAGEPQLLAKFEFEQQQERWEATRRCSDHEALVIVYATVSESADRGGFRVHAGDWVRACRIPGKMLVFVPPRQNYGVQWSNPKHRKLPAGWVTLHGYRLPFTPKPALMHVV